MLLDTMIITTDSFDSVSTVIVARVSGIPLPFQCVPTNHGHS